MAKLKILPATLEKMKKKSDRYTLYLLCQGG